MSAPPNWLPSKTTTSSWARAEEVAAGDPAGPDPTMMTSWMVLSLTSGATSATGPGFPIGCRPRHSPADREVGQGVGDGVRAARADDEHPEAGGLPGGQHQQRAGATVDEDLSAPQDRGARRQAVRDEAGGAPGRVGE